MCSGWTDRTQHWIRGKKTSIHPLPLFAHTSHHNTRSQQESRKPLKAALNEYWVQQLSKKLLATMGTYER